MLHWCSYCQRFLGDSAPYAVATVTHGICPPCRVVAVEETADFDRMEAVAEFFARIRHQGIEAQADHFDIAATIRDATNLNIRPIDLFVGVIQPVLDEIGRMFADCRISIAREHRFTAFAEALLTTVRQAEGPVRGPPAPLDCLLVCADGNSHAFGVRVVDFYLRQAGVRCELFYPGLPYPDIAVLATETRAAIVGMSVSMPEQIAEVVHLRSVLSRQNERDSAPVPRLVVGGACIRQSGVSLEGIYCHQGSLDHLAAHISAATQRTVPCSRPLHL